MGTGNNKEASNEGTAAWVKAANIALPIILTALIAVIGFLVNQIMSLKDQIYDLELSEVQHYGDFKTQLALQDLRMKTLTNTVNTLRFNSVSSFREEVVP